MPAGAFQTGRLRVSETHALRARVIELKGSARFSVRKRVDGGNAKAMSPKHGTDLRSMLAGMAPVSGESSSRAIVLRSSWFLWATETWSQWSCSSDQAL